jgi:ATP synthase F1 gamma subunit
MLWTYVFPDISILQLFTGRKLTSFQNASKNAGDMITKYQILFNRTRQAVITGELVEIITGAAASEE